MRESNVVEISGRGGISDPLTEVLRNGARALIERAVESELAEYLAQYSSHRTADDKAGVVRNGYLPERQLQTGLGTVTVRIPKVRSKLGEPVTFRSALVPPYVRKTRTLEAAVPWLYLKGVSSGEMGAALEVLLGAAGEGPVGEHRVALEAGVGARIPRLVRGAIGPRPLGVGVGGRCLQWPAGGAHEAVCVGGDRRKCAR